MTLTLKLQPRVSGLLLGHDNQLDVLVRVTAPELASDRPKPRRLNLSLVLDRSGSMSGAPLREAKRCVLEIVSRLRPDDYVSVVAYDNRVEVVSPACRVAEAAALREAVMAISDGGTTDLHEGWAAGAEQAARHVHSADISRVLLLSDGCANAGITDPQIISSHCRRMAEAGVSTSTYGLGQNFNEQLMTAMAASGAGNAYYGQTAADLMGPFQEEFDLLQALYARNLRLTLSPAEGVKVELANKLPASDEGWRLPDIAVGSEAWALLRLYIPAPCVGAQTPLLQASVRATPMDGGAEQTAADPLSLPGLAAEAFQALAADELVVRRAQEVRFAELQQRAASAAADGRWDVVDATLRQARELASENPWLAASMTALERYAEQRDRERFAKEAHFKSARAMSRLADANETSDYSAAAERVRPSFLRRSREEGRRGGEED
jgi:Ca-activated chloride channel family protein